MPDEVKSRRLEEIVELQNKHQFENNRKEVGREYEVLIEGYSKRSKDHLYGRNPQNKVIVFPKEQFEKGDYVKVRVTGYTSATLIGVSTSN